MKKKILFSFLAVLLLVGGIFMLAGCQKEEETIKIGFIAPLTGAAASFGIGEKSATKMAVEEINAKGGINGRKIEVIYEDGQCSGAGAVAAARKLIDMDEVKIILGGACSSETLSVAPIANENEVILFSAFSTNPQISDAGEFVFRNAPSDEMSGDALAERVHKDGIKKVSVISENTDYSKGITESFKKKFKKLGGEIISEEYYALDATDFKTIITKVKSFEPEAMILNPQTGKTGGFLVKQIRELGIGVPLYSGCVVYSSDDAKETGGYHLNNLVFIDTPKLDLENNKKAETFFENFRLKYDTFGSDYEIGARYDSVYIISEALKECEEDTTCIKDFLYNMDSFDGVIGTYSFDENGDVVGIDFVTKKIVDGKIIEISE